MKTEEARILKVENLTVRYGPVCALDKMSFECVEGQCVAVLGRNGAGKSSLLKALSGLIRSSGGSLTWDGQPVAGGLTHIAYLPQREEVDWKFPVTVRGLAEMGRFSQVGWWGRFTQADDAAVDQALEVLELLDLQNRQIAELSGGQQQRAFLARALVQKASVLLLDEPFAGLDLRSQNALADQLRGLAEQGRLIMASHHDTRSAARIFNHALLLDRTLVAEGDPAKVVEQMD